MESLLILFYNGERKFWGASIAFGNILNFTFENTTPTAEHS